MGSSLGSYEIARSGLYVNERGLFVTGHNIANANTKGFVRQQAMITTGQFETGYNKQGMYQLGLGADVQQIRQIRHTFLDNIYRQESTTLGYWESRNKALEDVQTVLGEPMGNGLQNVLNQFWDSWQELSKAPDSLTVRAMVRQRGDSLAYQLNHLGSQLDTLQSNLDLEITDKINEINEITRGIAKLNIEIFMNETTGDKANDLRDSRNVLADRLMKLVNAEINEMQDGQYTVTLGGYFLVNKDEATEIYAGKNPATELFIVPKFKGLDVDVPLRSGALKGLLDTRGYQYSVPGTGGGGQKVTSDTMSIADLKRMFNDLVRNIVTQVNDMHSSGYALGSSTPSGQPFFVAINPLKYDLGGIEPEKAFCLGNIAINPVLNEVENLVASGTAASGDNTIARNIANLRHKLCMKDGSGDISIDRYYQAIIQSVGNNGAEAKNTSESQMKLVNACDDNRQSIMGVSMDEEMTHMMKYQFAYSAASRVLNVIDEMIETVATRLGVVGR